MHDKEKIDILIVDDCLESLVVLERIIEDEDIRVLTALSGDVALGLCREHDFALILLDVQMPGMDGFELAERIRSREETSHIPIIFVTAMEKNETFMFKGYEAGAVDCLFKPVEPVFLRSKVRVFLELYRQRRVLQRQTKVLEGKLEDILKGTEKLKQLNRELEDLSSIDSLTGIYNRRRFEEELDEEWRRAMRESYPLSLAMVDIDFFKDFNDNYGHVEGDNCLKRIASILDENMRRGGDKVSRYGGEEFSIILPNTDDAGGIVVAERLRSSVEREKIDHAFSAVSDRVTISLGIASVSPTKSMKPGMLVEAADRALYDAKREGRNRVKVAPPELTAIQAG